MGVSVGVVDKVRQLLTQLVDSLPVSVDEFEELLNGVGCTVYGDSKPVLDHGDYVSSVVNRDCLDVKEDEFDAICEVYSVARYKLAWLGLACDNYKVVAVLKDLVLVERDGEPAFIAHYSLLNVVESERLYNSVGNGAVARAISKRKLREFAEALKIIVPEVPKIAAFVMALGAGIKILRQALEESTKNT
jgi:hypothetical protein